MSALPPCPPALFEVIADLTESTPENVRRHLRVPSRLWLRDIPNELVICGEYTDAPMACALSLGDLDPQDAWEKLAVCGRIPSEAVDEPRRRFLGRLRYARPSAVSDVISFVSQGWPAILTAEALVGELLGRLQPWFPSRDPAIVWGAQPSFASAQWPNERVVPRGMDSWPWTLFELLDGRNSLLPPSRGPALSNREEFEEGHRLWLARFGTPSPFEPAIALARLGVMLGEIHQVCVTLYYRNLRRDFSPKTAAEIASPP